MDTACEVKASTPLDQALARLDAEVEELGHSLNTLTSRLTPVLSGSEPSHPTPTKEPDYYGNSELLMRLSTLADRILGLCSRVDVVRNQVEV